MSRYVALCHVMSRHVTSCHVMSRHVTSCHVMSRHVTPCHVMSRHVTSCHVMSRHATSCHVMYLMSRHGTSCHIMSYHVMSRHVTSRHVTSCPVMSRHVISCYVISRRKSRDGHATNASLSTDFFHTQSIQIKHDRVRWLSRRLPIQYRISGISSSFKILLTPSRGEKRQKQRKFGRNFTGWLRFLTITSKRWKIIQIWNKLELGEWFLYIFSKFHFDWFEDSWDPFAQWGDKICICVRLLHFLS